ncbi:MAG: protein kinase, partial [Streptosporangiaceae bacterium]
MEELQDGDPRQMGPYMLTARLGAGGMGLVFLGHSAGGRLVAVKVIHPQLAMDKAFRARFDREVAAARKVGGFYAAPVVDADTTGPQPWLAVGYVDGPSLDEAVTRNGPMPEEPLLILAAGLAEGLGAIHAAGVIHRDLKPSNVMLAPDGVRVIDFGIARAADDTVLTGTGLVIGSPGFMSPEQASGRAVGPASDVFSMGGVLGYAATGEGPFGGGLPAEQLFRVVHGSPRTNGLPPRLRALVAECMDKDPARRPTAGQFLARLPRVSMAPQSRPSSFQWWPAAEPAPPGRPARRDTSAGRGRAPGAAGEPAAAADVADAAPASEAPAELPPAAMGATQTIPGAAEQPVPGEPPAAAKPGGPAPPGRRAGRSRLRWAIPVTAVVAAAIVALALFSTWPAPPLPVVQPTGLAAAAASNSAISIDWSGPKTGPRPGTYEIVEDGAVIGTAPGYITRYRRTGLSPATSYR